MLRVSVEKKKKQNLIWIKVVVIFGTKLYLEQNCIWNKIIFRAKLYLEQNCIRNKIIFRAKLYLEQNCIWNKIVFDTKSVV